MHKKTLLTFSKSFLVLVFFISTHSFAQLHIIPQPVKTEALNGVFFLNKNDVIGVDSSGVGEAGYLQNYIQQYYQIALQIKVFPKGKVNSAIKLIDNDNGVEAAYSLSISQKEIKISGNEDGIFYGIQSLIQMLPASAPLNVRCCMINDHPRFSWRGLSLDVSRHFFSVADVKKYIDMMAHYKLNVFHWHLTDDEGWRIQIDKYPLLTSVGARISYYSKQGKYRPLDNLVDSGSDGFYTKQDIRDVLQYAKERHVTILPEIEMPGHSEAAIFAYPELGCKDSTGAKHRVRMLDPSEYTFNFMENVLSEVCDLFPNQYIHIGGDEAEMEDWLKSPAAMALMKREGLKNVKEIQSYFIKRIEKFLLSKNKKLVGWDEILQGGLAESATVMSWRGEQGGIAAARMHHHVIMTPLPYMYFDAPQANESLEPIGWNPPVPWQMVYNYEPQSDKLSAAEAQYIIGIQGNLWAEKIPTLQHLEYMVYPRALAVAETGWSPKAEKNIDRFKQKLIAQYAYFKLWNLNARMPNLDSAEDIFTNKNDYGTTINYPLANARIVYSLSSEKPDTTAFAGKNATVKFPVKIQIPVKDTTYFFAKIVCNDQHFFQKASIIHVQVNAENIDENKLMKGLQFAVYKSDKDISSIDSFTLDTAGVFHFPQQISLSGIDTINTFVKIKGFIKIDAEDDYELTTGFEASPKIYLDNTIVIAPDLDKYAEPQKALLHLKKGYYAVRGYYAADESNNKEILLNLKTASGRLLQPGNYLFH